MGIDIRIETERAEVIRDIFDPKGHFGWLLSLPSSNNTFCLRFIDPYGNTVFNQSQLPILKKELESIDALITDEALNTEKRKYLVRTDSFDPVISQEDSIWLESLTVQGLRQSLNQRIALVIEAIDRGPHIYVKFVGD